jgi:predicted membrane protein
LLAVLVGVEKPFLLLLLVGARVGSGVAYPLLAVLVGVEESFLLLLLVRSPYVGSGIGTNVGYP